MIWRLSFVTLLFATLLTACGDRERVNCPEQIRTKNKAIRSTIITETTVTVDTASVGSTRTIEDRCP